MQADPGAESVARFINAEQVLITATRLLAQGKTFLQLEGSANGEIIVDGGDGRAQAPLAFRDGADKGAVKFRE